MSITTWNNTALGPSRWEAPLLRKQTPPCCHSSLGEGEVSVWLPWVRQGALLYSNILLTNKRRKCGRCHAIRKTNGCSHLWGAFR